MLSLALNDVRHARRTTIMRTPHRPKNCDILERLSWIVDTYQPVSHTVKIAEDARTEIKGLRAEVRRLNRELNKQV